MNGTKTFFACAAAAPRWFVVNEDNDHFFKCDSALMDEKGLSDLSTSSRSGTTLTE